VALPLFLAACGGAPDAAGPHGPGSTTPSSAVRSTTSTSTPATTTTTTPATTTTTGTEQPAFTAESVTFISAQMGWILGGMCAGTVCSAAMYQTDDAGRRWFPVPAPPISGDSPGDALEVRFANANDGWVIGESESAPYSEVWSTHNGGARWEPVSFPGSVANASIADLETADGTVYATFCGGPVSIGMSPVGADDWSLSRTTLPIGAGPICDDQFTLQRATGWLINVDRTVINGARLEGGSWVPWNPPCFTSGGPGELSASDALHLVAVCDAGVYAGPVSTTVSFSDDGGATFVPASQTLSSTDYGPIASPEPGVVVMGGESGLIGTFDGGASWSVLYSTQDTAPSTDGWSYVGFTTALQGVAIERPGTLLMTHDGGHVWVPVALPAPAG
jgi:photosystem II stability/assembly factor-like uncharacterized protein